MAKQLSIGSVTVYDHKSKYQHYYSNLKPPISMNAKTQLSFTFKRDDYQKKRIITKNEIDQYSRWKKEVAQQLKLVQESRLILKTKKPGVDIDPNNHGFIDQPLPYPFVEGPVKFEFGDHQYGNQLFLDQQKEILYQNINKSSSHHIYSTDDDHIYSLSTETGMMNSFVEDNLF